ncbi:MAG: hypothetical protein ACFB4J_13385 [Elainellaceae cyanobacterium]
MTNFNTSIADPHQSIDQWIDSLAKALGAAIKWRRRGNSLHILCEAPSCPDRKTVVARITLLLKQQDINSILKPGQPPIYQLWCYGRVLGEYEPAWSTAIALGLPAPVHASAVIPETSAREFSHRTASGTPSARERTLPRYTNTAIAQQLAKILSPLGIAVTTRVKPQGPHKKRLWVACQASYSPAPSIIAEPLSHELRQLPLEGVRDAVVLVKVRGEERVDWVLKIDLTPAEEILQARARWGDLEAIARLLNYQLESWRLGRVTNGSLAGKTLRFDYCTADHTPHSADGSTIDQALKLLSSYLQTLAPQGIQTLQLIDAQPEAKARQRTIAQKDASIAGPRELAQTGDLAAVQFLLSQCLNPDLDQQLATGGIRVQVLLKDGLLHVMCDGPLCPGKDAVAEAVQNLVEQLAINSVHGVRVYGRRAGQRQPRWRSGVNFSDRQRFVPSPSPTFAATDAYVTELMTPAPEISSEATSETPSEAPSEAPLGMPVNPQRLWSVGQTTLQAWGQQLRRILLHSQVFVPSVNARDLVRPSKTTSLDIQLALVWGTVGLLLFAQLDLATGWWLDSQVKAEQSPLAYSPSPVSADGPFLPTDGPLTDNAALLLMQQSPFPSFNNPQLDLKLALYQRYLQESGPPDVIAVGSSRAMRSIDPAVLKSELEALGYADASIFNFGVNGATVQVVDLILRRLLPPEHLPKLVIWADGTRAFNGGREDKTYEDIASSEGYEDLVLGELAVSDALDSTVTDAAVPAPLNRGSWSKRLFERYQALDDGLSDRLGRISTAHRHRDRIKAWVAQRFNPPHPESSSAQGQPTTSDFIVASSSTPALTTSGIEPDGFLPIEARFDPATYYDQFARVPGNYDRDYENFQLQGAQTEALRNLLGAMAAHDVPIVFVNTPLTQEYLDPFRANHEQTFRQYMIDTALQHNQFTFRDFGRLWLDQPNYHQYFSDPSHLNRYGAVELSTHLAHDPLVPWPFTAE